MPLHLWRIVKERNAVIAFFGERAFLCGGRWNLPRIRVVYTSGRKALAALEILVRRNPPVTFLPPVSKLPLAML